MMLNWEKLLCHKRLGREDTPALLNSISGRSQFDSDIDRITFSTSFRRLARKTQVFPLEKNDHVHNRLTHSLEVSRVGKTLGFSAGRVIERIESNLPLEFSPYHISSVVEAACLAHDIGHPPFGHAGDRAIQHWFSETELKSKIQERVPQEKYVDLTSFDGNAQGFRRLAQLEKNLFNGGLNLTYATLASYIKYPTCDFESKKLGFFLSEIDIVKEVAEHTGLEFSDKSFTRHPLSFLVEAADDICYGFLDLEDSVEMGLLNLEQVCDVLLEALPEHEKKIYMPNKKESASHRIVFAKMRGKVFLTAIQEVVSVFEDNYTKIMSGELNIDLITLSANKGDKATNALLKAKEVVKNDVFKYHRKVHIELSSYAILSRLMDEFMGALLEFADSYKNSPANPTLKIKTDTMLSLLGDHKPNEGNRPPNNDWDAYQCLRRGLDFITGMTDEFALTVSKELSGHVVR